MAKIKKLVPEDIISDEVDIERYEKYLLSTVNGDFVDTLFTDFETWLVSQYGKTLKQVEDEYRARPYRNITDRLTEHRFKILSEPDREFISAFDKAINEFGYDGGGFIGTGYGWGKYMIVYGKTGTKSRPVAARIYIKEDGITLRLFLNNVDKHREYIESAPSHIKDAFIFEGGDCKSCSTMCAPGKNYTIDGHSMQKCNHSTFYFNIPTLEKLPDYMALLSKFYPNKTKKKTK
jgi:hypothetical protein